MRVIPRHLWLQLLVLGLAILVPAGLAAQAPKRLILALGADGYLGTAGVQDATGATLIKDLGRWKVTDLSVIVLSNIGFESLPGPIQAGLTEFLGQGGSLLITGGPQSFGSGGYGDRPIAAALPFAIRAPKDWIGRPFRLALPVRADHPILSGIRLPLVGNFNDMNPKGTATEIAQYAGGGFYISPLIGEHSGAGTVLGLAFDPNEVVGSWSDGPAFVRNTIQYLLERSRIPAPAGPPK